MISLYDLNISFNKGLKYLENKFKSSFQCYISSNPDMKNSVKSPKETGSDILLLHTVFRELNHKIKIDLINNLTQKINDCAVSFFYDKALLPPDADTTSILLSTLIESGVKIDLENIVKKIASNVNSDGLFKVYFNPKTHNKVDRFDNISLSNICYFLYLTRKPYDLTKQIYSINQHIESKKYLNGTRYYFSPESNIYFTSRLLKFQGPREILFSSLKKATTENREITNISQNIAMRIITNFRLGYYNQNQVDSLLGLQREDGSWDAYSIYKYGSVGGYFGSKEISTGFALKAIKSTINYFKNKNINS